MALGDTYGGVKLYNNSLSLAQSFKPHSTLINRIKQSPFDNSNLVATCSRDHTVKIWNVSSSSSSSASSWTLIQTYFEHSSYIYALEWLDADTLTSSGYADETIKIWSLSAGEMKRTINTTLVYSLKLLASSYLAAGLESDINIYNLNKNGSLLATLQGHTANVNDLVQLNANTLASSSDDRTIRIWDLGTNECKFFLQGHTSAVFGLKQITSTVLASGSRDTTIKLWDTSSGRLIRTLKGHTGFIYWSLDLMDNEKTLVSGSIDQVIIKWNWSNGQMLSRVSTGNSYTVSIWSLAVIDLNRQQ